MQAQPLEKHPDCPSIACPPRATLWQLIWIGITPVIKSAAGGDRDNKCGVGHGGHASGGPQPLLGGRPPGAGAQCRRTQDGAGVPVPAAHLQGLQLDAAGARALAARHSAGRLCALPSPYLGNRKAMSFFITSAQILCSLLLLCSGLDQMA